MVAFRKCNGHMSLAKDIYNPSYVMEISLATESHIDILIEDIMRGDWDDLFLILMSDCPEQVVVEYDLREHALLEVFGEEAYGDWKKNH